MTKDKLAELSHYITFPTTISAISVSALQILQDAVNETGLTHQTCDLLKHPIQASFMGAVLGVAVGNIFKGDHRKANAFFVMPAIVFGVVAGYAADDKSLSPYAAAFASAMAGLILRRHGTLPEDMGRDKGYDDLDY